MKKNILIFWCILLLMSCTSGRNNAVSNDDISIWSNQVINLSGNQQTGDGKIKIDNREKGVIIDNSL